MTFSVEPSAAAAVVPPAAADGEVGVVGLPLQAAVDSARFNTLSIQSSFGEHRIEPGVLEVERGIPESVRSDLSARGHRLRLYPLASYPTGIVAAGVDPATGALRGAADVRRERAVIAW